MKTYLLITALIGGSMLGMDGLKLVDNEKLKTMYIQAKEMVKQDQEERNQLLTRTFSSTQEKNMEIQMHAKRSSEISQYYAMIGGELSHRRIDPDTLDSNNK